MNPYTHNVEHVPEHTERERLLTSMQHSLVFLMIGAMLFVFAAGVLVGAIIGTNTITSTNNIVNVTKKVITTTVKPGVKCWIVTETYVEPKTHVMFQCNDGSIKTVTM